MRYDLSIRASSLAEMFDCSARWQAKHLLGKWMPAGAFAAIGTAVHRGTAVFDTRRMLNIEASAEEAVELARDAIANPKEEIHWDDVRPGEAIDVAATVVNNYCHDISPGFTFKAVEKTLNELFVTAANGIVIRFTGKTDRKYEVSGEYGIADFKTGKQIVAADGSVKVQLSAAQIGTYELLDLMSYKTDSLPNLLPAKIIAMPTAGKQSPKVVNVPRPRKLLIGDAQHKGMIDIAAAYFKDDLFVGNPRSTLCSKKYCPIYNDCHWRIEGEAT